MSRLKNDNISLLILSDGRTFEGTGVGAEGVRMGELCFNTSMTGHQEILSDPSYDQQIVVLTFPHVGITGANMEDEESSSHGPLGCVFRNPPTLPSNHRATWSFEEWMKKRGLIGIADVDTRALTHMIRDEGALKAAVVHSAAPVDVPALIEKVKAWPGLVGMERATYVSTETPREYPGEGPRVVLVDYGTKQSIIERLCALGCCVTVVPATFTVDEIRALSPDGVVLSNGPGDPEATYRKVGECVRGLLDSGLPLFGICLGHQLLGLACGMRVLKMHFGHRGSNHPIKDLETHTIIITAQNHGFVLDAASAPEAVVPTHVSLFDGTLAGLRFKDKPIFSVQYHPEASPGPHDGRSLFVRFFEQCACRL